MKCTEESETKKKNDEYGRQGKRMILFTNQLQLPLQKTNKVVTNLSTV